MSKNGGSAAIAKSIVSFVSESLDQVSTIFIVLKVIGLISWPWLWVLSILLARLGIVVVIGAVAFVYIALVGEYKSRTWKK